MDKDAQIIRRIRGEVDDIVITGDLFRMERTDDGASDELDPFADESQLAQPPKVIDREPMQRIRMWGQSAGD